MTVGWFGTDPESVVMRPAGKDPFTPKGERLKGLPVSLFKVQFWDTKSPHPLWGRGGRVHSTA